MLRVGIVLDSLEPSAWIANAVERIQASPFARIELVLLAPAPRSGSFLFRLYEAWDYRRGRGEQDALAPVDASHLLDGVPRIDLSRTRGRDAETRSAVRGANLDVLVDFGSEPSAGGLAECAKHGVWRLRSDLDFNESEGRKGSWSALERNGVCASSLNRRCGPAATAEQVIACSTATLDRTSLYRSRNPVLWKHGALLLRELARLAETGQAGRLQSDAAEPPYRRPRTLETALYLTRYAVRWAAQKMHRSGARPGHKWHIAIRARSGLRFDDPSGYRVMPCPEDRFYADPFLFEWQGRTFLFFEDFRYEEGRALISCCELAEDGTPGEPFEVLRRPYHLSYPFVFEDSGVIYMVPESRANRTVKCYRATDFPREWTEESPLMQDVDAVDATILRRGGKYWMFAGMSDGRFFNSDEVSLFFADRLRGPWTPHPKNPLVSDVRRARPAGKLFTEGGRLIRPSQDCSLAYGYALVFSEVTKISETEYEEQEIARIEPSAFPGGVANHTYNRTERFEVVDRDLPRDAAILGTR